MSAVDQVVRHSHRKQLNNFISTRQTNLEYGTQIPGDRKIMYDELKEEEIVNKVGGRFKLSTLIQKRMVQLSQGARPSDHNQFGR